MLANPVLNVKKLTISNKLKSTCLVESQNFSVSIGEIVVLMGRSGEGKSTIIKAAIGLLPLKQWTVTGTIFIGTVNILGDNFNKINQVRQRQIRTVFQEPASHLDPTIRLKHMFLQEATITGETLECNREFEARKEYILQKMRLDGIKDLFNRYSHQLSGGERQRLALALALLNPVQLLIADEPTSSIDHDVCDDFLILLNTLIRKGWIGSLLFTTHDPFIIERLKPDRVLHLEKGRIIDFTCHWHREYLEPLKSWQKRMKTSRPEPHQGNLLNVKRVGFSYRDKGILKRKQHLIFKDITLSIGQGEFVGMIGPSGIGKSTLSKIILGLQESSSGYVDINHGWMHSEKGSAKSRIQKMGVTMVFQDPETSFDPSMPIYLHLCQCYQGMGLDLSGIRNRINKLMDIFELPQDLLNYYPDQLSAGQKQRFALIRALMPSPKLFLADEPFCMVDFQTKVRMVEHLYELKNQGMSMMLITHDIRLAEAICDSIYIMSRDEEYAELRKKSNDIWS